MKAYRQFKVGEIIVRFDEDEDSLIFKAQTSEPIQSVFLAMDAVAKKIWNRIFLEETFSEKDVTYADSCIFVDHVKVAKFDTLGKVYHFTLSHHNWEKIMATYLYSQNKRVTNNIAKWFIPDNYDTISRLLYVSPFARIYFCEEGDTEKMCENLIQFLNFWCLKSNTYFFSTKMFIKRTGIPNGFVFKKVLLENESVLNHFSLKIKENWKWSSNKIRLTIEKLE